MINKKEMMFKANQKIMHQAIHDLKYLPDMIDKEDLVQQASLELWKAILEYDEDKGSTLSGHCYSRVQFRLINWLEEQQRQGRKFGKNKVQSIDENAISNFMIEHEIMGNLLVNEISRLIGDRDTDLLVSKFYHKMTLDELSIKYKVNERTIRRRLDRAIDVLKNDLDWDMNTDYNVA